ncbi:hypothetical protein [Cryobacterium tepidiphilum]|uniref:Gluconate 2-dehydrogenase subunit 3 family protein n=1 Tax=Cryobacterium tepidiphilum TaxID=2486026 RepID=A0A3M8LB79_9MICO|nr:hypothetical protein [Cryobacterium tepidiphilum]RNE62209.1 hypothetical protein EEJ31_08990 [Cryobacterium tepidiphilum]
MTSDDRPSRDGRSDPGEVAELVSLARTLYPHPGLPDAPYQRTVEQILARASVEPALWHLLRDGLTELRLASGAHLGEVPATDLHDLLTAREETRFFATLRDLVAWHLYDDHEVWAAVGYPGASFEHGGYRDRGFNDLAWLPEPRIEESDAPFVEIGSLTVTPENAAAQTRSNA